MMVAIRPSAVVKVGGSLLDWPELPDRLFEFLMTERPVTDRVVIVVGGGRTVDVIRDLDAIHRFGDVRAHLLAIDALDLTARILGRLLPDSRMVADTSDLPGCWDAEVIPILAPSRFLERYGAHREHGLPASWAVTSDSIAAWIARQLHTDRLILLKSGEIPPGSCRFQASANEFVDPFFPEVSRGLKCVEYRNLRNAAGRRVDLPDVE